MIRTYQGSCHCGVIGFAVDLDLGAGTGKCNCSICTKRRAWGIHVKPDAFRLLRGQEALSDYQFGTMSNHHRFCSRCGCAPFGTGHIEQMGGDFVSIAVACLDDVTPDELAAAPVRFSNGRENSWWSEPVVTTYL
ncbi:GFA family protein [Sphingomonas sp. UYP23]